MQDISFTEEQALFILDLTSRYYYSGLVDGIKAISNHTNELLVNSATTKPALQQQILKQLNVIKEEKKEEGKKGK